MPRTDRQRIHLVDAPGLFYRAHFAFVNRPLTTSHGQDVGATFGFINTLLGLIHEERARHLAVTFDSRGPTFRHQRYGAYKATRPPMPPELAAQVPLIERTVAAFGLTALAEEGMEADDLIGSLTRAAHAADWDVVIVSADKDFAQLIGEGVRQFVPSRGREPAHWIDADVVQAKWGVDPEQFVDYLALTGDASDNVPGVRGIGAKTAARLLQERGSLDAIYGDLSRVEPAGVRAKLAEGEEVAHLSRELVRIRTDLATPALDLLVVPDPTARVELRALLEELEFRQLTRRLFPSRAAPESTQPGPVPAEPAAQLSLEAAPRGAPSTPVAAPIAVRGGWGERYTAVRDAAALAAIVGRYPREGPGGPLVAVDTETDSLNPQTARLVGVSLAWAPGEAWYVPVGHKAGSNLAVEDVARILSPLLGNPGITKAGQNLKFDLRVLAAHGIAVCGPLLDTMVASYLRDPDARHGLDALAAEFLGHRKVAIEELIGSGREQISMAEVAIERVAPYACEDVDAVLRLLPPLEALLRAQGARDLFDRIEMPLVPVLADMESAGILVDVGLLKAFGGTLARRMERIEGEVHALAGVVFNINSTQQLQKVLFEDLKLRPRRKTKTGLSTGQEVLEELAVDHPLPSKVLEYRQLAKLRGTYAEVLPKLVDARTGRIHTEFHQTVTATGRLSSSNPNLQNIPIRTDLGREIRRAFTAPAGSCLVSADYSQIELRLLAHLSGDQDLIEAFRAGADIHRATAARVFGVRPEQVDPAMRARAKVVNFGVLYGMGAQRLAREQGISVKEATRFIAEYFEKLPGVKAFIDRCVAEARRRGYAETLLGRRRYLPDLASARPQLRAAAERMAVNTPVQGSAADLMKLAMVRVHARLAREHPRARLLLQVHDELVLEVSAASLEAVTAIVAAEMSSVLELLVPLRVDTGAGRDWYEAHAQV
jgi:DNA polymerase I